MSYTDLESRIIYTILIECSNSINKNTEIGIIEKNEIKKELVNLYDSYFYIKAKNSQNCEWITLLDKNILGDTITIHYYNSVLDHNYFPCKLGDLEIVTCKYNIIRTLLKKDYEDLYKKNIGYLEHKWEFLFDNDYEICTDVCFDDGFFPMCKNSNNRIIQLATDKQSTRFLNEKDKEILLYAGIIYSDYTDDFVFF